MRHFLFALLLAVIVTALPAQNYCVPGRFTQTALFDSTDIRKDSNIVYAVSKNYFTNVTQQLQMDVYYADPSVDTMTQRPFILLIHGGAFLAGSRHDMDFMCMEYARRGFVVGTIDYRLGWNCAATDLLSICILCQGQNYNLKTATYEAAQDARAALRYITANAATWNASPNMLFVGGESAGSITALHAAFWDQAEASAFDPGAVNAVGALDTAGNTLPTSWSIKGVIDNCGAITKDSALLNNGTIPVISFHDELDCVVPYGNGQVISCVCQPFYWASGSQQIHNKLGTIGVCSELNTVPGSLNHCSYPTTMIIRRASCFLKRVMCGACVSGTNTNIWAIDSCDAVTGVLELGMHPLSLRAAPNPAQQQCHFLFSEATQKGGTLQVFNNLGQLVLEQNFPPLTTEVIISVAALPEGIYSAGIAGSNAQPVRVAVIR